MTFIYAIGLPETDAVHVHMTTQKKASVLYKKAMRGEIGATVNMAEEAQELEVCLSLHLLEKRCFDSAADAYYRCIAWQKLLQDAGYVLQSEADKRHVAAMSPVEQAYYEELKQTAVLEELLSGSHDLALEILRRQRGPRSEQSTRTPRVKMSAELYADLTRQARAHGMKLPELLIACATGAAIGPDLSLVAAYRQDLGRCLSLLQGMAAISPLSDADMQELLRVTQRISVGLSEVTQLLTDLSHKKK